MSESAAERPVTPESTTVVRDVPPPGTAMLLPPAAAVAVLVPGYEVLGELGRGGMGVVYLARQTKLQRLVALKMILSGGQAGTAERTRFQTEAEAIARLQHPNIVQVYEVGEDDGKPFCALEYCAGGSLKAKLNGTPLPPSEAAQLVKALAEAVQAAHSQRVIHRDLKPNNVLLTADDTPKISDFGLAKKLDEAGQTHPDAVLGTPSYMAPEQATGRMAEVGPLADVYSLGAILYECLTGRPPFRAATSVETLRQVLDDPPVPPTQLQSQTPRDLETICLKCLHKQAQRRYGSAAELADDLGRFQRGEPVRARPPSVLYQWGMFARRNKALVAAVLGIVIALAGGVIAASLFAVRATEQRDRADQERDEAVRQTYYARLAAAGAALRDDDVAAAALHLDLAPAALRDWEWRYFSSRLDESVEIIRLPESGFMRLASTKQGFRFVSVGPTELRVQDSNGTIERTVPRNGLRVLHVEPTPRGLWVIGQDETGRLLARDEAGQVALRLDAAPAGALNVVALSRDRTRLAVDWEAPGRIHTIDVYDLSSGQKQARCVVPPGLTYALTFSPNRHQIASASENGEVGLWDAATGARIHLLKGHKDKVFAVAYSPDGSRVVSASADGSVRQWDTAAGRPIAVPPYRGHRHEVHTVVYSPDGSRIASGDRDGTVRLWSAEDQQDIAVLHGHRAVVVQLAFSPDGRELASDATDGTARIWDVGRVPNPTVLVGHESYVYPVAYSPDGQWLASGSWDKTVRLWDARTGEASAVLAQSGVVRTLAFSPDGSWLVCACDSQDHLEIWDVATGQRRKPVPAPGRTVQAVAVSPDGTRIAAVNRGGKVSIVDVATGRETATFQMASGWAESKALAYSPDGRWLAGTGEDSKDIDIHDAQTGERAARLVGHTAEVYSVAFSRDGRRLVSAGGDHKVRLWDPASGELLATLEGHTDEVFTAVFHPDGRRLASAGRDQAILLWDIATGSEVARLQAHTNYIFSLTFSPDGTTLASGSGDYTVRLWDTQPLAARLKARHEAEALRPEAERLVARLLEEGKEPSEVTRSVREDGALSDPVRHEAQRALWRRLAPPE